MSSADDEIVSMKFDNAAFERNLSDTIKSLDNLRTAIEKSTSAHGLTDLQAASDRFHLNGVTNAVQGVSGKFLAMATIGITALSQITSRAISAGSQIVKSLTITPVLDGFREYETKIGSIQTILANTSRFGTTLDTVTANLDELNHYADKTIYSFGDMTKNIGLFTNAGIRVEDATSMIKGFSNAAAASGTTAEGAAGAAYQLSQALSAGTIRLMDWRSLTNVGMGNKNMQNGLIEIADAMGMLTKNGTSADEVAGNFNASLEKNWLSADVMSKYLRIMAGDMSDAEMAQIGLTKAQVDNFKKQQGIAEDAATKVRTFSQLMGTLKEAVGSSWSSSFDILLGNFDEATDLFTSISSGLGKIVGDSADARNLLLAQWKFSGGRQTLIDGLTNGIHALRNVMGTIKDAFREIFPPMTYQTLVALTERFKDFTSNLEGLSIKWMPEIMRLFRGFFATLEIGWTIIKGVIGLFKDLIGAVSGAAGGTVVSFFVDIADAMVALNTRLVEGGGITAFFDKLGEAIKHPIEFIKQFKENLIGMFEGFTGADAVEKAAGRISSRFEMLGHVVERLGDAWNWLADRTEGIRKALDQLWGYISTWFSELGKKLAAVMQPGDFDAAVDAINVGLLGGIILVLKNFMKNGLKLDFSGGLIEKMNETFGQLTNTLKAMQTDLKAKALLKIAAAVGILTVSVVALSMIDSVALTKALTALAVSFGQLIGAMVLMDKMVSSAGSAAKLGIVGAALIEFAAAAAIFTVAIKNLSSLSLTELAKGLGGIAVGMAILVKSMSAITTDTTGLIRAGVAMGAISIALWLLSKAVKSFAEMQWSEIGKGLAGVAGGLVLIVAAMNRMPTSGMVQAGAGLVLMAGGLYILSKAVASFAEMSWTEMGKGLLGVAVALGVITVAVNAMPTIGLVATGAGLVLVAGAMYIMSKAVEDMGAIKFGDLAKGLGAFTIVLVELSVALNVMNGTASGAAAMVVAAGAMLIMSKVLGILGQLSIGQIAAGLATIAAVLALLGGAAVIMEPVVPALMGLGIALGLVGGAFAIFGVGAMLVAKAFEIIAKSGAAGAKAIVEILKTFVTARVVIVKAFAEAVIALGEVLVKAAPVFIKGIRVILQHILETVIELVPQIAEALSVIITQFLKLVREKFPEILETGASVLLTFLQGIRDHAVELITAGVEMIFALISGIVQNMPTIVLAATNLIVSFLTELAKHAEELVAAGLNLLSSILNGIANNIHMVTDAITNVIVAILNEVANSILKIIDAGFDILKALLQGIADNIVEVANTVGDIVAKFIDTLAENWIKITNAGFEALKKFLSGFTNNLIEITHMVGTLVSRFVSALGEEALRIADAGTNALIKFLWGIERDLERVVSTARILVLKFMDSLADNTVAFADGAFQVMTRFLNALADVIRRRSGELREAGRNIAGAIIDGITGGLASKAGDVVGGIVNIGKKSLGALGGVLGINSPSKEFYKLAQGIPEGIVLALTRDRTVESGTKELAHHALRNFHDILGRINYGMVRMDEFNPTIRPVLDLSMVQKKAKTLNDFWNVRGIKADVTLDKARIVSAMTTVGREDSSDLKQTAAEAVQFTQNNYSPKALTTSDIYRGTKSLIATYKEELNI